jgi:type IV pilus assembly protein PilQ
LLTAAISFCTTASVWGNSRLLGISIKPAGDATEVTLVCSDSLTYQDFTLDAPPRIVLDLSNTTNHLPRKRFLDIERGGVRSIRTSQYRDDITRVVLDIRKTMTYSLFPGKESLTIIFRNPDDEFAVWQAGQIEGRPERTAGPIEVEDVVQASEEETESPPAVETAPPAQETVTPGEEPTEPVEEIEEPMVSQESPVDETRRITVDFQDADIRAVIRAFSEFSGQSIVAGREVKGKVTAKIIDLYWERAFMILMRANGYGVEIQDGIYRVDKLEVLRGEETLAMLHPTVFRLNYINPTDILETIQSMLSERGSVHADVKTNSIVVADVPERVELVEEIIPELDIETQQVTIKSKLLFIDSFELRQLGINWQITNLQDPTTDTHGELISGQAITDPFLQLTYGTIKSGTNVTAMLEALEENQVVDVQAQPQITTLDNLEAEVFVGERTPIRVLDVGAETQVAASIQLIETGIKLTVTPHITNEGKIIMELKAERSSAVTVPTEFGVEFQTQEGKTTLLVDDGQTAVIGGLTTIDTVKTHRGVPMLSSIPFIGHLFKFSSDRLEKRDLLIFVTPYIVS